MTNNDEAVNAMVMTFNSRGWPNRETTPGGVGARGVFKMASCAAFGRLSKSIAIFGCREKLVAEGARVYLPGNQPKREMVRNEKAIKRWGRGQW